MAIPGDCFRNIGRSSARSKLARLVVLLLGAELTSCRAATTPPSGAGGGAPLAAASTAAPSASAIPPPTSSGSALTAGSPEIDTLFRAWEKKLPEPDTMSESNGFSTECERHGGVTYNLLAATAKKLPVRRESDVAALVPWARSGDACIRQIAVDAIVAKINEQAQFVVTGEWMVESDSKGYRGKPISPTDRKYSSVRLGVFSVWRGQILITSPLR